MQEKRAFKTDKYTEYRPIVSDGKSIRLPKGEKEFKRGDVVVHEGWRGVVYEDTRPYEDEVTLEISARLFESMQFKVGTEWKIGDKVYLDTASKLLVVGKGDVFVGTVMKYHENKGAIWYIQAPQPESLEPETGE